MFFYDWTFLIIIPPLLLALFAQAKVKSNYVKYSKVRSASGYTGEHVAKELLRRSGINDVDVVLVKGELTDHYDPRTKTVALSNNIFSSNSIAALSIAAHEVGHAIQHNVGYNPLKFRSSLFPVASIGSNSAIPLFILGIFLSAFGGTFGYTLMLFGIFLFTGAVLFQVITLPVEFNASKRAIALLEENNFLQIEEVKPAKEMLNSAALTYVAATATAIAQLARLLAIYSRSRR